MSDLGRAAVVILRWFGNALCILTALAMFARKYGFEQGTLWLLGMGAVAAVLLMFRPMRMFYPGLLAMIIVALFSATGLAIDRFANGPIFTFKHSHFDGLMGVPLVETRSRNGETLHIFEGGLFGDYHYAIRSAQSWFPQVSYLPEDWKKGDPLPGNMTWITATR